MRRNPGLLAVAGFLLVTLAACSGGKKSASPPPTILVTVPTRPPAQAPVAGDAAATPQAAQRLATPVPPPPELADITSKVQLRPGELPQGFGIGQFQAFQPNEAAVTGYENPQDVLARMNGTGRLGGFLQQISSADSQGGVGVTIDLWRDAAGAKAYFDQYPRPDKSVDYKEITLPNPPGEQVFAFQTNANGQTAYSITWRRGRLILGVGEIFPAGKAALDRLQPIIDLVDKKAAAAAP